MRSGGRTLISGLVAVAVFCLGPNSSAYVSIRYGPGGVRIQHERTRIPLTFQTNEKTLRGTANFAGGDVSGAFRSALDAWRSISTAKLSFREILTTTIESASSTDGVNLITMADTAANSARFGRPDVLALTFLFFDTLTGRIVDADIVFNPKVRFSTNLSADTIDLQSVATHEIGHALGCDHSPALNDTMFWSTKEGEFFQRHLSQDSVAFATATYPDSVRASVVGSISGRVTQAGTSVFGASVSAMEVNRNLIYTALTDPDGSYKITGPISGKYTLWVEPLDGPARTTDLAGLGNESFYRNLSSSFRTVVFEDQDFHAALGGIRGPNRTDLNFAIPSNSATLNISLMGRGELGNNTVIAQNGSTVVSPGETINLFVGGPQTAKVNSFDDIAILGTGVTIDRSQPISVFKDGSGSDVGFAVAIRVAADASPGPRTVLLKVGDERVACTGGIVVAGRSPTVRTLYIPFLTKTTELYTGLAIANPSKTPAAVRIFARDFNGDPVYEEDALVPSEMSVGGGAQVSRLESQLFNLPPSSSAAGSMTLETDSADLQGLFLTGDTSFQFLDGAETQSRAYKKLYFTDVIQNSNTKTEIHLMNVRESPVSVKLLLMNPNGAVLRSSTRSIPGRGKIEETVSSVFTFNDDIGSGYVHASAEEEALVGFELIRQSSTIFGMSAQPEENAAALLYSAHLAAGEFGIRFSTRLNILNVGSTTATLSVTVFSDNGRVIATPTIPPVLLPGGQISVDAQSFFGLTGATEGSVQIAGSTGAKLVGNVVFSDGDPRSKSLGFSAAVPLAAAGSKSFLFSHVAHGKGYYTGVALLALEDTTVTLEVFRSDGSSAGSTTTSFVAGSRQVRLLDSLIPSLEEQVGGYIKVTSSKPVIGFELFGSTDGLFLSAVPPQSLATN